MKFIKGLVIGVFVFLALVFAGAYVFLKFFDVNQYRPQIVSELAKQLGRDVTIGKIGLNISLFNGVYAEIIGLKISEDSRFGEGDFASVGALKFNVDVLSYLSRREIVVSKVTLDALKVSIVRDESGAINAEKIGQPANVPQSSQGSAEVVSNKNPSGAMVIPNFSVKTIAVNEASVVFVDKTQKPPMRIDFSQLDIVARDFSLDKPFRFESKLAVLGSVRNFSLDGQARVDVAAQKVYLSDVQAEFDLTKLKVDDLVAALPQVAPAGLKDNLGGQFIVETLSLSAGAKGLEQMSLQGRLQDGRISTLFLPAVIEKITMDFSADAKDFDITSFSLALSSGTVTGKATIFDYMATQRLNAQIQAIGVPLSAVVGGLPEGMKLAGGVNANLILGGQNLSNPEIFLSSLKGSGQFEVKDGKLENFNLLKTVLGRIELIPGLAAAVEANMPQQYSAEYIRNETVFQKISSKIEINAGVFALPDCVVLSNLFEADMQVKADSKLNGKVSGQIKLPLDLSEYLVSQANALAYLKNGDGRIVIALTSFEGPLASLKIIPDVKALGKAAIAGEGVNQLNKFLNKALKTEDSSSDSTEPKAPAPQKELINNVLDKIFQ